MKKEWWNQPMTRKNWLYLSLASMAYLAVWVIYMFYRWEVKEAALGMVNYVKSKLKKFRKKD